MIYNPSLGANLISACTRSYFDQEGKGMPLSLAFLVLPLTLHWQTAGMIASTNISSGLTLFASKLGAHQEDLLAVHQRTLSLRALSFTSISMACATRMLILEAKSARLFPLELDKPPRPSEEIKRLQNASGKLGAWFSRLSIEQVTSTLRIEF